MNHKGATSLLFLESVCVGMMGSRRWATASVILIRSTIFTTGLRVFGERSAEKELSLYLKITRQ